VLKVPLNSNQSISIVAVQSHKK